MSKKWARRERRVLDIRVSSVATNSRVVFQERVEVRETIFDGEGDWAQKESDIGWVSEKKPSGNRLKWAWFASG